MLLLTTWSGNWKTKELKNGFLRNVLRAAQFLSEKYLNNTFSEKITVAASLFTTWQLKETIKKNKGRRFTLDEKILSLLLYKCRPECYCMLSSIMFNSPSPKILHAILNTVSITRKLVQLLWGYWRKKLTSSDYPER